MLLEDNRYVLPDELTWTLNGQRSSYSSRKWSAILQPLKSRHMSRNGMRTKPFLSRRLRKQENWDFWVQFSRKNSGAQASVTSNIQSSLRSSLTSTRAWLLSSPRTVRSAPITSLWRATTNNGRNTFQDSPPASGLDAGH